MANAFSVACQIEAEGQKVLMPWLSRRYENVILNVGGRLSRELQRNADVFVEKAGSIIAIELKIEAENKYKNLYLESWSNKSRFNPGWMLKSDADTLLYYFLDSDEGFAFDFKKLRTWAFDDWQITRYPEKPQGKYSQLNDTWGWCVPIQVCFDAAGVGKFNPKKSMQLSTKEAA